MIFTSRSKISYTGGTNLMVECQLLLPPANKVWGKVIFSQACVKNSVHTGGVWSGGCLVETPPAATAAGSTHPTGMHSCFGHCYHENCMKSETNCPGEGRQPFLSPTPILSPNPPMILVQKVYVKFRTQFSFITLPNTRNNLEI